MRAARFNLNYRIAQLDDSLTLTPTGSGCVVARGPVRVELTLPAVAFLLLVDGLRTIENLEALAASLGMPLPPGFAAQLLEALVTAGLAIWIEADDIEWQTAGELAHACDGCGRSCEGHLVGPLPQSEVTTIQEIWPAMVERVPRLAGHKPLVRREEGGGIFLQQVDGQCLFLEADKRCAIHREVGPLHKPSICRMFPFQRVLTESGVRLGVSAACYRHHATGADAPAVARGQIPPVVLDRESYQQLAVSAPPAGRAEAAANALAWEALLRTEGLPKVDPAGLTALVSRFCQRVRAAPWAGELLGQPTQVAAGFRDLLAGAELVPVVPGPDDDEALRELLERMHFLGETAVLGGPRRAVVLMMMGHHLAARLDGAPHVERLVAWFWLLTTESSHRFALQDHEVDSILSAL